MPFVQNYEGGGLAYLITEGENTYLMVLCDEAVQAFRFKVSLQTLSRLNVESAARILTHVQGGHADIMDPRGKVILTGETQ